MENYIVYWFRRDLRLHDNAGLYEALKQGKRVLPLFIFDTEILNQLSNKADKRVYFIHQALRQLKDELLAIGSDLLILHGSPLDVWKDICQKYNVTDVYCNKDYEPYAIARDRAVSSFLKEQNISFNAFKDHCIFEYSEILKADGLPYVVFTPYARQWKARLQESDLQAYPNRLYFQNFQKDFQFPLLKLETIGFETQQIEFPKDTVCTNILLEYKEKRDIPSLDATSKLSIHFRFGTISIREKAALGLALNETWLNELIWRDFYIQIMAHFPLAMETTFRKAYERIECRNNPEEFEAWCEGKTGYPLVDAGMRELHATGFMHNRLRMVVASFLCKHLLIDYRWGEAYFAEKLLDFDLASNNGGWQWAFGSGVDAAPYFRIFNPALQLERFDPNYVYVKRHVPEYGTEAYPKPIVEHKFARARCLEAYKAGLTE